MVDWDARYCEADGGGLFGREPNDYVREIAARRDFTATSALCLADGDGRNGRWLAAQGLEVTAIDLSKTATHQARKLDAAAGVSVCRLVGDLATWTTDDDARWQSVFIIYLQCERSVRRRAITVGWEALCPGGWLVLEGFSSHASRSEPAQATTLGPSSSEARYRLGDIRSLMPDAIVIEALEGQVMLAEGAKHAGLGDVVRLCVRRPHPDGAG